MPQILLIALGPIQDFIAAGRRCRDLWFGSWVLSELSKATAHAVGETPGAVLVFPGAPLPKLAAGSETSVANKIVVCVPDGISAEEVAEQGRVAMRTRLTEIRRIAFQKIDDPGDEFFHRAKAVAQVDDLIEYVWASAPEGPAGYGAARQAAEALLGARKNTRLWGPVPWGAAVPKSSIDGERESVIFEEAFAELDPAELRHRFGIGKAERLCGVGLLKRHGTRQGKKEKRYGHHFLSTGHLAAWPLLERMGNLPAIEKEALKSLWKTFLDTLLGDGVKLGDTEVYAEQSAHPHPVLGRSDAGLLFETRIADLFEGQDPATIQEPVRRAREALAPFLKRLKVREPWPYYAILVADGDHMGRAIQQQKTIEGHQALSRALDTFAGSVTQTVEKEHGGELIYAGGDDVLAFVPLHRVLACAQALAKDFGEALADFPVEEGGGAPTLSVGIGICHFLDPMGGALHVARRAEKLAKTTRNALAVIVDKRSGPEVETLGPWGMVDQDLAAFVQMHWNDWVPDGAAYELRELARLLDSPAAEDRESLEALVRKEAARILRRKQPRHGEEAKISEATLKRLLESLNREEILNPDLNPDLNKEKLPKEIRLKRLADRLVLARTLARAEEEANPHEAERKEVAR
jgi:CRISPR-associated protein Cmr2